MTRTLIQTAAIAAFFAFSGAALAEETHTSDNSAVLESVYAKMDANRAKTFEIVLASAETRLADKIANMKVTKPASSFVLASN